MSCLSQGARRSSHAFAASLLAVAAVVSTRLSEAAPPDAPASPPSNSPVSPSPAAAPSPPPAAPADAPPPGATPSPPSAAPVDAPAPSAPPVVRTDKRRATTVTWDVNVEGGAGYSFEGENHLIGFGRVRGGLLFINEGDIQSPVFTALGVTYDFSDFSPATFGIQAEALSLSSGVWAQVGAMVDIQPRPGFMLALGVSLIGVEGQVRWSEEHGAFFAAYAKLRIPVGVIGVALRD